MPLSTNKKNIIEAYDESLKNQVQSDIIHFSLQGMDPPLPPLAPLRRNWSDECDAERDIGSGGGGGEPQHQQLQQQQQQQQQPQATTAAPFFNRVVEFEEKEEDVYKPQPEIPGLVLPGIERRRSSKKKRSTAQIAEMAEKARDLKFFQSFMTETFSVYCLPGR